MADESVTKQSTEASTVPTKDTTATPSVQPVTPVINPEINTSTAPPTSASTSPTVEKTSEKTSTGMTVLTILLLFFVTPIGLIIMWVATHWPKWVKWLLSIILLIVPILLVLAIFSLAMLAAINPSAQIEKARMQAGQQSEQVQPMSVTIDAGAPLECTKLEAMQDIDTLTASYGCAAPGAYLESVDTIAMTASYFTTDTQRKTVTYGPVDKPILEVQP